LLTEQRDALQEELGGLKQQLESAHLEGDELRRLVDEAKETIDEALNEQQLREEQHEAHIERMSARHTAEVTALENKLEHTTTGVIGDAESRISELKKEHEKALTSLEAENLEALQKAGYDYQEKLLQKEQSLLSLKEALEGDLAEAHEEITTLRAQVETLASAAAEERRDHDDGVATINAERADLLSQVRRLEAELASTTEKLNEAQVALDHARQRWDADRAELKQVKNSLAGLVRALDETVVKDLED
jgi:chromosome segregation ATPase